MIVDTQDFDAQALAFGDRIEKELQSGRVNFPTSLEASLRIKRLIDDEQVSLARIAQAVSSEPVLSARVVRAANSVALNPSGQSVDNVSSAVQRVGLGTVRSLAIGVAAEQIATDHRSHNMRTLAEQLWHHSMDVASWAYVIARQGRKVSADVALLAGMMVDIGQFLLLARASEFPAMEADIARFVEFASLWSEPVGRAVLRVFDLPDQIVDAYAYDDPRGRPWPPESLFDVVLTATLAAETLNPFDTVPGGRRGRWESLLQDDLPVQQLEVAKAAGRTEHAQMLAALSG
jgi:HD-like signal output (HDOD) protein